MDRRDSLKALLVGSIGAGATLSSCQTPAPQGEAVAASDVKPGGGYGRTEEEVARDMRLKNLPSLFNEHELETLAVLADIILPADDKSGKATDAGVVEFIDYIVKEFPDHQMPMRGALGFVDREAQNRHDKNFIALSNEEQLAIIEDIAYPENAQPEFQGGAKVFSKVRDLVMTGFYTSQEGVKDLGYVGNVTNFWDGVPDEVLQEHGFSYEEKYADQYITQAKREVVAQWDEAGNLVYESEA